MQQWRETVTQSGLQQQSWGECCLLRVFCLLRTRKPADTWQPTLLLTIC
jgi:hypothetical protein